MLRFDDQSPGQPLGVHDASPIRGVNAWHIMLSCKEAMRVANRIPVIVSVDLGPEMYSTCVDMSLELCRLIRYVLIYHTVTGQSRSLVYNNSLASPLPHCLRHKFPRLAGLVAINVPSDLHYNELLRPSWDLHAVTAPFPGAINPCVFKMAHQAIMESVKTQRANVGLKFHQRRPCKIFYITPPAASACEAAQDTFYQRRALFLEGLCRPIDVALVDVGFKSSTVPRHSPCCEGTTPVSVPKQRVALHFRNLRAVAACDSAAAKRDAKRHRRYVQLFYTEVFGQWFANKWRAEQAGVPQDDLVAPEQLAGEVLPIQLSRPMSPAAPGNHTMANQEPDPPKK